MSTRCASGQMEIRPQVLSPAPSVAAAGEDPQDLPDVGHVVAVGPLLEVTAERGDRLVEPPDPAEEKASIAAVIRVGRLNDHEQLDGAEGGRPVTRGEVGRTQVSKDAGEDFALAARSEHARVEQDSVADRPAKESLAIVGGEAPSVGGRVEDHAAGSAND